MANVFSYYSFDKVLSYNAVYNFVIGARGLGKTFGAKKKAINDYLNKGWQFIYLRRYKDEIKDVRSSFFADIAHFYPNVQFRVKGKEAQITWNIDEEDKNKEWHVIGYFLCLSRSQSYKSVSFHMVHTIIYDEFIIEKGVVHYLANESKVFNDFYSTVDRYQDRTRVLFLANSMSIMNPYFLEYGIIPGEAGELVRSHGGFIVAHFPDAAEFVNEVYRTRFGQFIQGTEYSKQAVANVFKDNHDHLLETKTGRARYKYTLETIEGVFTVWHDVRTNLYYITSKRPGGERLFTTVPENMREGWQLMNYNDKLLQFLRTAFRKGMVYFDNPVSRNAFVELFRR